MRIKKVKKMSKVHGRIFRTYIFKDTESDREIHNKLGELIKGKNVLGVSFSGDSANFDTKRHFWQL